MYVYIIVLLYVYNIKLNSFVYFSLLYSAINN